MPVIAGIYYHLYEGSNLGQKPPVLLIHGAGGNHLYWPAEVRRLAGYRVHAPDLAGHGKSDGRSRQTISGYAESILDWLAELGIHSAVFVGHSMGSAIALCLALDHPEHVTGLGLVAGGARLKVAAQLLEYTESPTTYLNAVKMVVDWSFSPGAPPRLIDLVTRRMSETRPSVLHSDFRACSDFDVTDRLGEINKPTLIVCGAEDKMTPLRYSQYLAEQIAGAQLRVIPEAGHMVQIEKPRPVADALLSFLNGIQYL